MFNPIRLPQEAFKCATCNQVSGTCEHTFKDGKHVNGAKVIVVGIIEGYIDSMETRFEISDMKLESYKEPSTSIFKLEN